MFETDLTGQPVLVDELDADWLLVLLAEKETAAREAERGKLRLAAQWCVLHPATADTGVATWGDTGLPGMRDHDESLGGEGTPLVAAFTPEPFAAALGVSTMTGMQLLADALDLRAPACADLVPGRGARGGAVEGPQGRPGHARSVEGGRGLRGRRAGGPAGLVWGGADRAGGGAGDREVPPRAAAAA